MKGSLDNTLKIRLKAMIIEECDIEDISPEEVADNVHIFSDASGLGLDSLDALQISVGLQSQFGIRLPDSKAFRRHASTINDMADFIQPE
ncbi:MAG: acyl carrier protein [Proteobacteria bacterium]|nr:acyl carrier protein [Pseudomonadota bacterium]MBU1139820.1 acyl carrier protein [Pseudomonadota bacterium]MBU1232630.1 acyl carrier protein [Pseudomonadota bacterium]MBU1418972.1 acyl carrier protein [Pseudomonadota bacterium]MBU1455240.1 acyl carrier protein [Pseudomonadota bacterium]